jgi:hypothetical protein
MLGHLQNLLQGGWVPLELRQKFGVRVEEHAS